MNARLRRLEAISRRDALQGLAGAGGAGLLSAGVLGSGPFGSGLLGPDAALAQGAGPWAAAPRSKVDKLNFVVWTYGDIYARIARQFETDWGVKVESTISSFNDHPTKLATMYAAARRSTFRNPRRSRSRTSSRKAWSSHSTGFPVLPTT